MTSWKTTLFGVCTVLFAVWQFLGAPMLDGDPATVANFTALIAAATPGFGIIFARDNNVTSEEANAGKKAE